MEVAAVEEPRLNAQVMASRLASSLERGWFFRRAGNSTAMNVMAAGARGCLIVLSGKLSGARHRTQKFQSGHIKYCGETALTNMDVGYAVAVKKLGTIGCTVAIMRAGTKLPSEISIKSREESGLDPLPHDFEITVTESESEETEETPTEDEIVESIVDAVIDNWDSPFEDEKTADDATQEEE